MSITTADSTTTPEVTTTPTGSDTPRPRTISTSTAGALSTGTTITTSPSQRQQLPGTGELTALLGEMKVSLGTIGQIFESLTQQSAKIPALGPTMKDAAPQLKALQRELKKHARRQDEAVLEAKRSVRGPMRDEVVGWLRPQLQLHLQTAVARAAATEIAAQISTHLPVPLAQQAVETGAQLKAGQVALANSEARRANARLASRDLDEPIQAVVSGDGERSRVFPVNLRSLFSYEGELLGELLRDCGLREGTGREENLSRFMAHIGIDCQVLPLGREVKP